MKELVTLGKGEVLPKYAIRGMSHQTKPELGGTTTYRMCTIGQELLNSPRITKEPETKPSKG